MILDKQSMFSEAQAVTATAVSTNVVDLGADHASAPQGNEKEIGLLAQVVESFSGGTSVQAVLETAIDAVFTSPITVFESAAVAVASLKAGYQFALPCLPAGMKRFARMKYVVVGVPVAGKITSGLVLQKQTN